MFGVKSGPAAPRQELTAQALKNLFENSGDLCTRSVALGGGRAAAELCWLDGCVTARDLSEEIVRPLSALSGRGGAALFAAALAGGIWAGAVRERRELSRLAEDLSLGSAAVFLPGADAALAVEVRASIGRSVEAPTVERSVLGSRESFTETLRTNTALLRRRLPGAGLVLRELRLGRETRTAAALVYLSGAAAPERVETIWQKLNDFSPAGITASGELERSLTAPPRGLFPQMIHTERPDRLVRGLLRGQVGLLCDGLSVALLLPVSLPLLMTVEEDRSRHALVALTLRLLRYAALLIALLLPAVYTAAAMYHPEMIPHPLLQAVIRSREHVPFSTAAEVLGMLFSFELIQEAGVRLPEPVGQTVSLIGALIVGQSAVEAKLLSPLVIIVVALAGIGGYAQPSQELTAAVRLWRFALVLLGAALGLFGVMAGGMLLLWRLCSMENLGVAWISGEGTP